MVNLAAVGAIQRSKNSLTPYLLAGWTGLSNPQQRFFCVSTASGDISHLTQTPFGPLNDKCYFQRDQSPELQGGLPPSTTTSNIEDSKVNNLSNDQEDNSKKEKHRSDERQKAETLLLQNLSLDGERQCYWCSNLYTEFILSEKYSNYYVISIEFQARGASHIHWRENINYKR